MGRDIKERQGCFSLIFIYRLTRGIPNNFLRENISNFPGSLGAKYSYSCLEDGYVIDMPGYPEEIEVECDFPPGYHSNNWVYDLWKSGVWTNFGNITRCIDPNRLVFLLNHSFVHVFL